MYCFFCDDKMYGLTLITKKRKRKKKLFCVKLAKQYLLIHTTLLSWVEFFQRFNTRGSWNKNSRVEKKSKINQRGERQLLGTKEQTSSDISWTHLRRCILTFLCDLIFFCNLSIFLDLLNNETRKNTPMHVIMSTRQVSEADPSRCSTSKKSQSTERVRKFHLKQKQAVG